MKKKSCITSNPKKIHALAKKFSYMEDVKEKNQAARKFSPLCSTT